MEARKFKPNRDSSILIYFSSTSKSEPNRIVREKAKTSVIIKSPPRIMRPERDQVPRRVDFAFHHRRAGERAAPSQGAADLGGDGCSQYTHHLAALGTGLRHPLLHRRVRPCQLRPIAVPA